jgi:hypothetical protein
VDCILLKGIQSLILESNVDTVRRNTWSPEQGHHRTVAGSSSFESPHDQHPEGVHTMNYGGVNSSF